MNLLAYAGRVRTGSRARAGTRASTITARWHKLTANCNSTTAMISSANPLARPKAPLTTLRTNQYGERVLVFPIAK